MSSAVSGSLGPWMHVAATCFPLWGVESGGARQCGSCLSIARIAWPRLIVWFVAAFCLD
ncbi:hypothetical protein RISK_004659 [Rhodopirellula islandica]|uniref:Uncharacterized protein n=1 Tax=Rhodopirellula islandica TaxID=595434 RepID=A0A0J1B9C7_RHOIS|nr:hypothetical protein RISK_004659 [Rhodopirellula islandica]